MSEPKSPYEAPYHATQRVRWEPWYLRPLWALLIYLVLWPFWLVIIPLATGFRYLRAYWRDVWSDTVELWKKAYVETPVAMFHFLKSRMGRRENDKTDHHQ